MNLGEKVRAWRVASGFSVSALARLAGTSRQNIDNLEKSGANNPHFILGLAKAVGQSVEDLKDLRISIPVHPKEGKENPLIAPLHDARYNAFPAVVGFRAVPLLSSPPTGLELSEPCRHSLAAIGDVGPNGYALRVSGNSMLNPSGSPSFPDKALIFVNPDLTPSPGKFIVATLPGLSEFIFRRLIRENGKMLLEPLNPRFEIEPLDTSFNIVGVVVGSGFDNL